MAAIAIELAEAIRELLAETKLSLGYLVARSYVPLSTIKELEETRLTVMPSSMELVPLTRGSDDFDYTIDVGVQRFINSVEIEKADPYMRLVEEVIDLFRGKRIAFGGVYDNEYSALCVKVENTPIYNPEHLDEHKVFTSVAKLTFRMARSRP